MNYEEFVEKVKSVDDSPRVRDIERLNGRLNLGAGTLAGLETAAVGRVCSALMYSLNRQSTINPRQAIARILETCSASHADDQDESAIRMANSCPENND